MHHDYIIVTSFNLQELKDKVETEEEEGYTHLGGISEIQCRVTGRTTFVQAMISKVPV